MNCSRTSASSRKSCNFKGFSSEALMACIARCIGGVKSSGREAGRQADTGRQAEGQTEEADRLTGRQRIQVFRCRSSPCLGCNLDRGRVGDAGRGASSGGGGGGGDGIRGCHCLFDSRCHACHLVFEFSFDPFFALPMPFLSLIVSLWCFWVLFSKLLPAPTPSRKYPVPCHPASQ